MFPQKVYQTRKQPSPPLLIPNKKRFIFRRIIPAREYRHRSKTEGISRWQLWKSEPIEPPLCSLSLIITVKTGPRSHRFYVRAHDFMRHSNAAWDCTFDSAEGLGCLSPSLCRSAISSESSIVLQLCAGVCMRCEVSWISCRARSTGKIWRSSGGVESFVD